MWRSEFLVCLALLTACGGESDDASGSTGGTASGGASSGGAAGASSDGGMGGLNLGGSSTGGFGGSGYCRGEQCTGPHTIFEQRFTAECRCEPSWVDTDPAACTATCVAEPLDAVYVSVALDHSAVGDLTIKLQGPDGTVVTLLNRPGFAEPADDGADGPGASAKTTTARPIRFRQSASDDAEQIGVGLAPGTEVCPSDDLCTVKPAAGAAGGPTLDAFAGMLGQGDWTVCVGDSNPGETANALYVTVELVFPNAVLPHANTESVVAPVPDDAYDGTFETMACGVVSF